MERAYLNVAFAWLVKSLSICQKPALDDRSIFWLYKMKSENARKPLNTSCSIIFHGIKRSRSETISSYNNVYEFTRPRCQESRIYKLSCCQLGLELYGKPGCHLKPKVNLFKIRRFSNMAWDMTKIQWCHFPHGCMNNKCDLQWSVLTSRPQSTDKHGAGSL